VISFVANRTTADNGMMVIRPNMNSSKEPLCVKCKAVVMESSTTETIHDRVCAYLPTGTWLIFDHRRDMFS
jgi:hypothetical protein